MSRPLDPQLLLGFLDEVEGYLPAMRDGFTQFRADPSALLALDEPYCYSHSIKGTASLLDLPELTRLAALIEEMTEQLADGRLSHDLELLDTLLQTTELIADYVHQTRASDAEPNVIPDPVEDVAASPEPKPEPESVDEPPPEPADLVAIPPELLEVFRLEADDHLRALTTLLPECRKSPSDRERWAEVRRAAHTLKGAAAMVGFENVTQLAHRMEDLLDLYYDGARTASSDEIDLLLAGSDAIEDMIAGRANPAHVRTLGEKFNAIVGELKSSPEIELPPIEAEAEEETPEVAERSPIRAEQFVRVPIDRLTDVVKLVGELVIARTAFEQRMSEFARLLGEMEPSTGRLRRATGKIESGYEASALLTGTGGGRRGFGGGWDPTNTDSDGSIEFDFLEMDRYTEFHLLSRELAETTSDIQMVAGELGHLQIDFDGLLTRQARLSSELEDKLMRLRMVPLSSLTTRLQRTIRNASQQCGKSVELALEGERTGLDKTVLEAMADPLLHLLRNAVDHGLETPEARTALGKPESGTISLKATHEGSQVVLTIHDDGRGIDAEEVRSAIVRRELLAQEQADRLGTEELFAYLFQPGFSTKGEVTELSGRGVGLDVVKTTVTSLKGTVAITSEVGHGTTFTIRLPMTLAITRALMVRVSQQTFAIPLDAVEQIVRLEDVEVNQVGHEQVIEVNGKLYPVTQLAQVLKLRTPADVSVARRPVLLLKADGRHVALVIDQLLGGREIVIKNLSGQLRNIPAVSGATLMGDGSVVLILNPSVLVKTGTEARAPAYVEPVVPTRPRDGVTVLIVDDSPSVRRVLTALVQRVGWRAVAVKDGLEALETLQRGAVVPDVALLDIEMPRMDGYELLSTLRGQTTFEKLPVVMITSRAGDKHRQKALDLGANAYLVKPYQDDTLIDVVRQLTRAARS